MYQYPLTAINIDGSTVVLYNEDDIRKFKKEHGRWYDRHVETYTQMHWDKDNRKYYYESATTEREWICRDDFGKVVNFAEVEPDSPCSYRWFSSKWEQRKKQKQWAIENGGPIPGTGPPFSIGPIPGTGGWGHGCSGHRQKNSGVGFKARSIAKAEYDQEYYDLPRSSRDTEKDDRW